MKFAADLYSRYSILAVLIIMIIIGIASNYYHFYYLKDYNYVVRVVCLENESGCKFDDCETGDDQCAGEIKAGYKEKLIKAYDFSKCGGNCAGLCNNSSVECIDFR